MNYVFQKIINQSNVVIVGIFVEYQFSLLALKKQNMWEKPMKISSSKEVCFTLALQLQVVNVKIYRFGSFGWSSGLLIF